jgi:hypothetical protein
MSVSDLVGEIDDLRDRTRRASFSGAVPLALLGLLVAFAAPFYAAAFNARRNHVPVDIFVTLQRLRARPMFVTRLLRLQPGGPQNDRLVAYWLLAVPVAFLLVAGYYGWRARRTGIALNGWRVVIAGAVVLLALVAVVELPARGFQMGTGRSDVRIGNFVSPLLVVAAGTFAVAWVERSRAVLAVAVVFLLGVVAVDTRVLPDWGSETPWDNVQSIGTAILMLAGWLLGAAATFAVVAARRRRA